MQKLVEQAAAMWTLSNFQLYLVKFHPVYILSLKPQNKETLYCTAQQPRVHAATKVHFYDQLIYCKYFCD